MIFEILELLTLAHLACSCASLLYVLLFFTNDGKHCIKTFSKYCTIEKYGILKTHTSLQYCKGKENTKQKNFF